MPTPDAAPSPALSANQSTQQISSSQAPEAASSRLEIILPPTQQPSPDAQPETAITAANPLLSSVEWDPQTNTLLLPSGLEVAQILSAGPQTSIVLEDGTILRLSGLEEDVEPLIKIDDQILSAQEIQQAFAAFRNVEPGAGPETAASTPAVFITPETSNTEPAPSFTEPEPAQGGGNNFEPISIAVQPAFPITPLLLPSEATIAQNTPQTGADAAQDLPPGPNTTDPAISPPDTETPPTLSISSVSSNLFEAGLSNGSASGQAQAQASGSWTIMQSDSPIASLCVYIPSQGQWIDVTNGGQITTDFGVLTVTVAPDGTYNWTYELSTSLDHGADNLEDILNVKVIDESGKEATAPFSMQIVDDTPSIDIADAPNQIGEGETLTGSWSLIAGADGVSEIEISVSGQSKFLDLSGNEFAQFILIEGKLTIKSDGTYSFEASKDLDHTQTQSITFTLTATDGDGDTTTDTHSIFIGDGDDPTGPDLLPGQDAHLTMTVEEAALDNSGSDPSSTAETEVSSSLIFTAGSDDLDSFTFADPSSITVSQAATNLSLTWSQNGNQLLGSINGQLAVILQLDANTITAGQQGSVTVTATLIDAFPHTGAQISINGLKVIATDTDGDQASADIHVIITDDTPTITISDSQTAVEEGEVLSSSWSLTPGADGVSEVTVSVPGQDSQTIQRAENASAEFVLSQGKLIVNPDGTYSFEAAENLDHSQDQNITFSLTATDGDGDTSTDTHTLTISDGTDPTGPDLLPGEDTNLILTLEEAAIDASGSNPDSPAETMVSSSLSFTAGSDNLASFAFADPAGITVSQATNALNLTWSGSGNQLIGSIEGQTAIILQVEGSTILAGEQGTVKVTATLTNAFPHEDTEIILNAIKVIASDTDGDQAIADVRVIITDDSPTLEIADGTNSVVEGETLTGSWSLTPGADGVNEITVSTPDGSNQTLQLSDGETVDIEFVGKGTLTVKSDGTYTFTSDLNLDHTQAQSISFTLTATDADGDTTSDTHTISITDGPDPQGGDLTTLDLDESALPGGSNETSTAEQQTTTLQFEAGSDNITSIQFGDTSSITVRNGAANPPTTISWVLSSDSQKLTGSINSIDVIELNLTSALIAAGTTGTSQISASLLSELPHATANTVDIIITGIQIKATDSDGSQSTGLLNISIKDDTPDVDIAPSQNLVLQGETISDQASIIGGADGLDNVFVSLDNGPAVELGMSNNTASKFYSKLGVLSVKADGSWEFTANTGVELGINDGVQFLITVQDGDGDTDTDSHFISIKQGADPIIGTQADDVLTGTETAELIKGLKGDDTLSGGGGNDRLEGGKGKDMLEGGSGSDTFVLDTSNINLSDLIVDYDDSGEDADKLDVTELIGSEDITQENVGNYFQYSGGVLSFDQDSAGTNYQMIEVATFANPPQQVELIVDEAQAPVVVAAV